MTKDTEAEKGRILAVRLQEISGIRRPACQVTDALAVRIGAAEAAPITTSPRLARRSSTNKVRVSFIGAKGVLRVWQVRGVPVPPFFLAGRRGVTKEGRPSTSRARLKGLS